MGCDVLNSVRLNWNPDTTTDLKITIAFIIIMLAPGITKIYFIYIGKNPMPVLIRILVQIFPLPIFTFFNELRGVTIITARRCICHEISVYVISPYFSYKSMDPVVTT